MNEEIDYTKTISMNLMSYEKEVYEYICSNFIDNKLKILELGCGYCNLLKLLDKKFQATGIDNNYYLIDRAKELKLDVIQLNIETRLLSLKLNNYDIIILNQVLEHLKNPLTVLEKCKFLLKFNGIVIISVPNSHFMTRIINTSLSVFEYRCAHLNAYDTTHLVNLLKYSCGYKIEEIFFSGEVFPNMKGVGKKLDKLLGKTKLFKRFSRRITIVGRKKEC